MRRLVSKLHHEEDGHVPTSLASLVAAAGPIVLAIGAAGDNDTLTIIGGIVAGVGVFAYAIAQHVTIDWEFFRRTSK